MHMLGRSLSFFLLVLGEDEKARLEKTYGSKVTLRRSKGHLSNEVGNLERGRWLQQVHLRIFVHLT